MCVPTLSTNFIYHLINIKQKQKITNGKNIEINTTNL